MKKFASLAIALVLITAVVAPAVAGDKGDNVKLTGWITDEWCGAKNANAEGSGCAKSCAKNGAQLVLFVEGKMYKLSDQKMAKEHIGYKVEVTGTLSDEDTVAVKSIKAAEKKA